MKLVIKSFTETGDYQLTKIHCVRSVRIWSFSGPYFPAFRLNTEIWIFLRTQAECRKIRTRKTPNMDTFHAVVIIDNQ